MSKQLTDVVSDNGVRCFSYRRAGMKIYTGLLLLAWFLGFIIWPIWRKPFDWVGMEVEFAILVFIFIALLTVNFYFQTSDIEVSRDAIGWTLFGWRWKEMKWGDVDRIRVLSSWDFENGGRIRMFSLARANGSRFYFLPSGSITFNERITSFTTLVGLVRLQAESRGIRVEGGDLS